MLKQHKQEFFVNYFMYVFGDKQSIVTVPSPNNYSSTYLGLVVRADVTLTFDQVPDAIFMWDYGKEEWIQRHGEPVKYKVTHPVPCVKVYPQVY